jgi:hypothetical protein
MVDSEYTGVLDITLGSTLILRNPASEARRTRGSGTIDVYGGVTFYQDCPQYVMIREDSGVGGDIDYGRGDITFEAACVSEASTLNVTNRSITQSSHTAKVFKLSLDNDYGGAAANTGTPLSLTTFPELAYDITGAARS